MYKKGLDTSILLSKYICVNAQVVVGPPSSLPLTSAIITQILRSKEN